MSDQNNFFESRNSTHSVTHIESMFIHLLATFSLGMAFGGGQHPGARPQPDNRFFNLSILS